MRSYPEQTNLLPVSSMHLRFTKTFCFFLLCLYFLFICFFYRLVRLISFLSNSSNPSFKFFTFSSPLFSPLAFVCFWHRIFSKVFSFSSCESHLFQHVFLFFFVFVATFGVLPAFATAIASLGLTKIASHVNYRQNFKPSFLRKV